MKTGTVNRGVIQASLVQLNRSIADYARLDIASGILVSEITKGGNAEKAGIKGGTQAVRYGTRQPQIIYIGGDIITGIDGIKISSLADYFSALESKRPGDTVKVTVHRNRTDSTFPVVLAAKQK